MQNNIQRGTQVLENLLLLARLDPEEPNQLKQQAFNMQQLINEEMTKFQDMVHTPFNWYIDLNSVEQLYLNEALW
jgi:two-component system, OmpR family, sensor histidine kinase QseC